jgi:hypothetical protein
MEQLYEDENRLRSKIEDWKKIVPKGTKSHEHLTSMEKHLNAGNKLKTIYHGAQLDRHIEKDVKGKNESVEMSYDVNSMFESVLDKEESLVENEQLRQIIKHGKENVPKGTESYKHLEQMEKHMDAGNKVRALYHAAQFARKSKKELPRYESYNLGGKIDLAGLFEGEELSEEFKSKVAAVFEAAVEARVKQEMEVLADELVESSLTESEQLKEGLVDKVDGYLDYVVEQWMQKNELALDRGIKVEIFESFIAGMKDLFETHHINVPEEQIDLMEEVDARAKELEAKLDEAIAENVQLHSHLKEIAKETAILEATDGLSDLEAERFKQLAEELAYDDEESFVEKLSVVKENFTKTPKAKSIVESVVTDSPVELKEETQIDPRMARYMRSIKG